MALLWITERDAVEPRVLELADAPVSFDLRAVGVAAEARIITFGNPPRQALIAADGAARVNGEPLRGGVRVLRDQDCILLGPNLMAFFCAYSPPRVIEYSPTEYGTLHCPVCTRPLEGPVVRCPRCGRFFCESDDGFNCWSAGPTCPSGDGQPTSLDAAPEPPAEVSLEDNWP